MNILQQFANNIISPGRAYPGTRELRFGKSTIYQDGGACSSCYSYIDVRLSTDGSKGHYEIAVDNGHGNMGGDYAYYEGIQKIYCNTIAELLDILAINRCPDGNNAYDYFILLKQYMIKRNPSYESSICTYVDFARIYETLSANIQTEIEKSFFAKYEVPSDRAMWNPINRSYDDIDEDDEDEDYDDENDEDREKVTQERNINIYFKKKPSVSDIIKVLNNLREFTIITITNKESRSSMTIDEIMNVPVSNWDIIRIKIGHVSIEYHMDALFGSWPNWPENIFYVLKENKIKFPKLFYDTYCKPWDDDRTYEKLVQDK